MRRRREGDPGWRCVFKDEVDSTNDEALRLMSRGEAAHGVVVAAESQSKGRGRGGNSWFSPRRAGLWFSVVLMPDFPGERIPWITQAAGLGLATGMEKAFGVKAELKWPNDLLLNGRKVCGILIESSVKQNTVEYAVVGIGLNVNQRDFPPPLIGVATSLAVEAGHDIDRPALFREVLCSLEKHYEQITSNGYASILPQWLTRSTMLDTPVSLSSGEGTVSGIVRGLSAEGGLILQTQESRRTYFAGDVTVLKH